MEWIEALQDRIVGLDTSPLIYFIEENPTYLSTVRPFFEALDRGEFQVVTSTITLLEVLIHPFRQKDPHLALQYRDILLNAEGLVTLPLAWDITEHLPDDLAPRFSCVRDLTALPAEEETAPPALAQNRSHRLTRRFHVNTRMT